MFQLYENFEEIKKIKKWLTKIKTKPKWNAFSFVWMEILKIMSTKSGDVLYQKLKEFVFDKLMPPHLCV